MKPLLICPYCERIGAKIILGEIDPEGRLRIMRFHSNRFTIISGDNFDVMCNLCGETIFFRRKEEYSGTRSQESSMPYNGLEWFHRLGTQAGTIAAGS